jgi:hypothetical protein
MNKLKIQNKKMAIIQTSNSDYQKEQCLIERIDVEQKFAKQVYSVFREKKFGIASDCYFDYEYAIINKAISDWKYSNKSKMVISTDQTGVFVEPLASINKEASISCPVTPSNICSVIDLKELLNNRATFIFSQLTPLSVWTITHNLGEYPSVTIVDLNNNVIIGDITYINNNVVSITFLTPVVGYAYLN